MDLPDFVNLIGRIAVAFYFLWAFAFNFRVRDFHLGEFERIGVGQGAALFFGGQAMILAGGLLLLYRPTAVIGASILIVFTIVADAFFHRYWTYSDAKDATIHKLFLLEHIALIGGLLGITSLLIP